MRQVVFKPVLLKIEVLVFDEGISVAFCRGVKVEIIIRGFVR